MIRYLTFIAFLTSWVPVFLQAQNLVPNPSFECADEVPCGFVNEFDYRFPYYACGWTIPNRGTSDIFATDNPESCWVHMPHSTNTAFPFAMPVGSQMPHTGNRFAGIFTYSDRQFMPPPDYREYLQVQLTEPLQVGEHYCAEMYVSLSHQGSHAANKLGMHFHVGETTIAQWDVPGQSYSHRGFTMPYVPQVVEESIILDKIHWVRISRTIEATTPANYFIIGNFSSDLNTQAVVTNVDAPPHNQRYAYYYVDDVSVQRSLPRSIVVSGNTTICEGDTARFTASGGLVDIEWTALPDTLNVIARGEHFQVKPGKTTSYRVKGRNCNGFVKDTVMVTIFPRDAVRLGPDRNLCAGQTLSLDGGEGYASYRWSTGVTSPRLTVTSPGVYSVDVTTLQGCMSRDTIAITGIDIPHFDLGSDTTVCATPFSLKAGRDPAWQYQWSTGVQDSVFVPDQAGIYWVAVRNECGQAADTIRIYSRNDVFIPNVVTINEDQLNGRFMIKGGQPGYGGMLKVYNRWGELLFSEPNYENDWPAPDSDLPAGVYYYRLDYPGCRDRKGWIHVLKN